MTGADGRGTTDTAPGRRPDGTDPDRAWTLAGTRPVPLALRTAIAALGVGVVGGMATGGLTALFGGLEDSSAARLLAVVLPLVLVAMIGWRLTAAGDPVGSTSSGLWLASSAAVGVVLLAVVQAWSEIGGLGDSVLDTVRVFSGVMLYGALFGAMTAAAAVAVLVPVLLLLRASRVRTTLRGAQLLLTALPVVVTAASALWVTGELDAGIVTGTAAALAGTGAALTAGWVLVDPRSRA